MKPLNLNETAERYIYEDYASWDDDNRYELIDGVVYMMSPAPSQEHQRIIVEIAAQLWVFLKGKPCKVFAAPFDVCLNAAGDKDKTVVQPDIVVVCDKSKLDGKRCNGAPDMAVEILSPSTSKKDKVLKFDKYREAGVREYWIVDPEDKTIHVYILRDGEYIVKAYGITEEVTTTEIPVHVLEGCLINIRDVFAEENS